MKSQAASSRIVRPCRNRTSIQQAIPLNRKAGKDGKNLNSLPDLPALPVQFDWTDRKSRGAKAERMPSGFCAFSCLFVANTWCVSVFRIKRKDAKTLRADTKPTARTGFAASAARRFEPGGRTIQEPGFSIRVATRRKAPPSRKRRNPVRQYLLTGRPGRSGRIRTHFPLSASLCLCGYSPMLSPPGTAATSSILLHPCSSVFIRG
jgi:hypothetical protein